MATIPFRRGVAVALIALSAACLHRLPPQRLATPLPISVTMLEDRGDETFALPDEVAARIGQDLEQRNLVVRALAPEPMLGGGHNSQQRFATANSNSGDAAFALLIETRVAYYDLLEGQYRWVVYAKLTASRRGSQLQPAVDESEIPVFLQYAHQKQDAALDAASRVLAEKAAALIDGFIAPPRNSSAPNAPVNPFAPPTPQGGASVESLGNIYFVLLDRFSNGDAKNDSKIDLKDPDAFHGGDLQGVINELDHLQKLGVQTIWLSPVFATRQEKFFGHGAYHGYWVEDLTRVEPRFGDIAALEELSRQLHQRGMKLLLDLVLNHVAFDSPLLKTHPDWFHHQGSIEDWNDARQLENRDVDGLPDLAQENEEVYRMLRDASLAWIDRVHPDGFRLDAVKHVPLAFWRRFDAEVHAHAGAQFVLLGEALEGTPSKLAALQRAGGFDSLFDFPLGFALTDVFCKGAPPERLAAVLSLDRLYADANALATLVDNHDLPRVKSLCGGDDAKTAQLIEALGFMRGVPAIQYGTEAGLIGEKEPANRGDLFEHADARAYQSVSQALHLHDSLARLNHTILLDAGQGAVAIARFNDDEAAVLLFEQKGGAAPSLDLASLAPSARADGPSNFVPGELRIVRLHANVPNGFASLRSIPSSRELAFRVDGASGKDLAGDVFVAGAGPELGDWDPAHAVGPIASGGRALLQFPTRSVVEFKLILKHPDGSVQWESGPDRFIFISEAPRPLEISLAFRS